MEALSVIAPPIDWTAWREGWYATEWRRRLELLRKEPADIDAWAHRLALDVCELTD